MLKSKVFKLSDKTYLVSRISEINDKKCYIKLLKLLIQEMLNIWEIIMAYFSM